jgi:hypothetical protein
MPRRTDSNQQQIMDAFRACGWWCHDTHTLPGFVDFITAPPEGKLYLIEVKINEKAKLRPLQEKLKRECPAEVYRINSVEEADEMIYRHGVGLL